MNSHTTIAAFRNGCRRLVQGIVLVCRACRCCRKAAEGPEGRHELLPIRTHHLDLVLSLSPVPLMPSLFLLPADFSFYLISSSLSALLQKRPLPEFFIPKNASIRIFVCVALLNEIRSLRSSAGVIIVERCSSWENHITNVIQYEREGGASDSKGYHSNDRIHLFMNLRNTGCNASLWSANCKTSSSFDHSKYKNLKTYR